MPGFAYTPWSLRMRGIPSCFLLKMLLGLGLLACCHGQWSPDWAYGDYGESCNSVCAGKGGCSNPGRWPVLSRTEFESISGAPCPHDYYASADWAGHGQTPYVDENGCLATEGYQDQTVCSGGFSNAQRLCCCGDCRDACHGVDCGLHGSCSRGACICESGAYTGDRCQDFGAGLPPSTSAATECC